MSLPVRPCHSFLHDPPPQRVVENADRVPSKPAMYMMPPATTGPPSVTLFAPKEAVASVCMPATFAEVNACSAGLVFRCRADWPNCGHSLGGTAAPAAPACAAAATRTSAAAAAHALILDLNRIGPPSAGAAVPRSGGIQSPPEGARPRGSDPRHPSM